MQLKRKTYTFSSSNESYKKIQLHWKLLLLVNYRKHGVRETGQILFIQIFLLTDPNHWWSDIKFGQVKDNFSKSCSSLQPTLLECRVGILKPILTSLQPLTGSDPHFSEILQVSPSLSFAQKHSFLQILQPNTNAKYPNIWITISQRRWWLECVREGLLIECREEDIK